MTPRNSFDVIIVGGSYAGLSAAMSLGRSLRNTLIIDGGSPCNRQTPHAHNFITHDGEKPSEIAEKAKKQVMNYDSVSFVNDFVVTGRKTDSGFEIETKKGEKYTAKKLIFATGVKDEMPEITGFSACWGISVVHCPYCHGYEIRNQKTGILANGEKAFHLASLVSNLTKDLVILTNGKADFSEEQLAKFRQKNIDVIETEVTELIHENGSLNAVVFAGGKTHSFTAVYAAIPFRQHLELPVALGCELTEFGHIKVNPFQMTDVPGVFACGDNSSMLRSLANAVNSGNLAGVMANKELVDEEF